VTTLFLTCAVLGGVILLAQLALGVVGIGDHEDASHHTGTHEVPSDGLQLLSVRALAAGVAFFGLGGLAATLLGVPAVLAVVLGVVLGAGAMVGVAMAMRSMLKLERDASVRIEHAVGSSATVYVPVPAAHGGVGKVLLTLKGRTVEYQAVTPEGQLLPTGTPVVVVDVRGDDTVEVVPLPSLDGVL
jgi:membrane protein implicated in regulation of membrane protease activity